MLPFTFRQIQAFLALCEKGTFAEAASELGVSQPAVSRLIKSLEDQLGFDLVDRRRGHPAQISARGKTFQVKAQSFVDYGQRLGATKKPKRETRLVSIRSYVGGHIMSEYLRQQLPQFHQRFPHVAFEFVKEKQRRDIVEDIVRGKIDFAVFSLMESAKIDGEIVGYDEAGIVAAAGTFPHVSDPAALAELPFALPPKASLEEQIVLDGLAAGGITPTHIYARAPFPENRLALAAGGQCVTYSTASVRASFPQYRLEVIRPMPRWTRWLYLSPRLDGEIATAIRSTILSCLAPSRADRGPE